MPLILICNDDGVTAPGINALIEAVQELGDIFVVAPDKPQSGSGHAITIDATLRTSLVRKEPGLEIYSCTGTPVDCIKLAVNIILPRKPDIIISGINHGANSSINVIYSGTMSAAIEGSLENIPSAGFSLLDHSIDADFSASRKYARIIVQQILEHGLPNGVCLNVNIPRLRTSEIMGIRVCRQAKAVWKEEFDTRKDPAGKEYYWMGGQFINLDEGEDADVNALKKGYVSVVPTQSDLTAYDALDELKSWEQ